MTRVPSERIERVARLAAFEAESLVRQVREAARALDAATRQLGDLRRFRGDYARSAAPGAARTSGIELANRGRFVARIDRAIAQKTAEVDTCTERWQKARATWISQRQRSGALANVAERYQQAERADAERVDQAEADDQWASNVRTGAHQYLAGGSERGH
ncbi:MAG TPA: flagellar export protein FliJ [Rhodanobacteraceae bacterium]|nr:flagellar export protein FliJ [Rhodanobacteraceae bacterium]